MYYNIHKTLIIAVKYHYFVPKTQGKNILYETLQYFYFLFFLIGKNYFISVSK